MSSSMVNLVVKNLFGPAEDIMLEVKKDMTVLGLKEMLSHECKSRPVIHDQQIVHYGRLLKDDSHLGSIPLEGFQPLVLHLIVKGDTLRGILNSSHYNSPGYANSHIAPVISLPSMVQAIPVFPTCAAPTISSNPFHQISTTAVNLGPSANLNPSPENENQHHHHHHHINRVHDEDQQPVEQPPPARRPVWFASFINLKLVGKLLVLIFLFGQDGDSTRLIMLSVAAVITYLYSFFTRASFARVSLSLSNILGISRNPQNRGNPINANIPQNNVH
eukprot:jgi/Bigna1/86020/estExt_fgenesh1_pg.C_70274